MDWEPIKADHAIDSATVNFGFTGQLDADAFDDLTHAARQIAKANGYDNRVFTNQIPIQPIPGEQVFDLNTLPRPIAYRRLDQEGVPVDEFHLSVTHVGFVTRRYPSWAKFSDFVRASAEALDNSTGILGQLRLVKLQYVDRFNATSPGADHFEIINRESQFLVNPLKHPKNAFHSHIGWFEYETELIRRLTNVNIDVTGFDVGSPPGSIRSLGILTLGQYDALIGTVDGPIMRLDRLHDHLKLTLRDIITNEAAERISLNGPAPNG